MDPTFIKHVLNFGVWANTSITKSMDPLFLMYKSKFKVFYYKEFAKSDDTELFSISIKQFNFNSSNNLPH